jgi:hypothetical protein
LDRQVVLSTLPAGFAIQHLRAEGLQGFPETKRGVLRRFAQFHRKFLPAVSVGRIGKLGER